MIDSFVTKEMIYQLARTNPVVAQFIMLVEHSKLDYTSALASCVYYLAKESEQKSKMLIRHLELCPRPFDLTTNQNPKLQGRSENE